MTTSQPVVLDAATPLIHHPRDIDLTLPKLRRGGVNAVLATIGSIGEFADVVANLGAWRAWSTSPSSGVQVAHGVGDTRAAREAGSVAIILHVQGLNAVGTSVEALEAYSALGVRVAQLTYNYRNMLGDGCLEPSNAGLSDAGRRVVRRLNELRIIPDISHAGEASSHEILDISERPVVASHSNARKVCDHPRNLTDALIRAVAESDGVVGVCAFPAFVSDEDPSVDDLARHAAYIAELVGPEHVGMGLDYADEDEDDYEYFGYDERYYPRPPWRWPKGIESHEQVPNLSDALRAVGFSAKEVDGLLGENFMRVFAESWLS